MLHKVKFRFAMIFAFLLLSGSIFAQSARLQVIHNSADVAAAEVDIYLWNTASDQLVVKLDDFAFRAATPFVDVPAGDSLDVIIAGPGSTNQMDQVIATIPVGALADMETYVVIANGVLDPNSYAANPDGRSTGFELLVKPMAKEAAESGNVEFFGLHGATDAPTVDLVARGVATLVDDAAYTDMTDYIPVPEGSYILDVTPGSDNNTIVASFQVDLNGLAGGSAVVFASGFLTPSSNQNGAAFGLFAALADGSVVEFPAYMPKARLQVIHNSADVAAAEVDIYLWNTASDELVVKLDDFAFRAATPFVDVPAGDSLDVIIAGPGSTNEMDQVIATIPVGALADMETYVVIANGVLNTGSYAANPDGRSTGFELLVKAMARESAESENVEFFALHGATDAPTVDVIARGVATLVDDAAYTDMTDYIPVPAGSYRLDVTPGSDNNTIVASFAADLSGLGGGSAVVFASGFLTPSANLDGAAFGLFAALSDGTVVEFPAYVPQARLQVIHNSADVAAALVDIYLMSDDHSVLAKLDDFAFRAASPFIDVPAETDLSVIIAGPSSTGPTDAVVATIPVGSLNDMEKYVVIANGVLVPASYAENPDGKDINFELLVKAMAREAAESENVEFFALHGATDAPTVDVIARGVATLVDDAAYTDMTGYIPVPAASYVLDVTPGSDNNTVVASFTADLSGLGGGSAVVFASGFLTPSANMNGEAFGLFAALANGTVVEFPAYVPQARLQVIHNSADVAAEMVDIYLQNTANDTTVVKLDDFAFRAATPFVDVPAGDSLDVVIAGPNSTGPTDAVVATIPVGALADMETYVVIANGVLVPSSYAENPDGRNTGFELLVKAMARESAESENVEFFALHGATDAPTVDVIARDVATLVDDAAYTDMTGYIPVPAGSYILDVTPGSDNNTIVASFAADLSGLGGGSAVVFASGFLTPSANQDGDAFGLFAALSDGTVVEFPAYSSPMARLQVIHNSADVAAAEVDIYLWNTASDELVVKLDDFAFRAATPFVDVPAKDSLDVIIAGPGSTNEMDQVIATIPVGALAEMETYVVIANGVLDPSGYAANPDERSTGFELLVKAMARESAESENVEFFVLHGATDAPTVDVIARDVATLVDDAAYTDMTDYIPVPEGSYILDVTPGSDNNTIVASFTADLNGLSGGSAVVFASGFLTPSSNQDGAAFGLFAALSDGTVVEFPGIITDIENEIVGNMPKDYKLSQNYPNPFNPSTIISFSLPSAEKVSLKVYNILGSEVATLLNTTMNAGYYEVNFDASNLASGTYFYNIQAGSFNQTRKMNLIK